MNDIHETVVIIIVVEKVNIDLIKLQYSWVVSMLFIVGEKHGCNYCEGGELVIN